MTVRVKVFPALEVHWGGPAGSRDTVVAYLEYDGKEWSFHYAENLAEAIRQNFDPFKGLPEHLGCSPIKSSTLFPAFAGRIPTLKRGDVVRAAGDLSSLPREEAFYEFLRRSGGRTGTDQIWFTEVQTTPIPESEGLGKALRNEIRKMVAAIRELLEEDIREQLESTYGILPDGRLLDPDQVCGHDPTRRNERDAIESAIRYAVAGGRTSKEAVENFTREIGFTYLNRLAALKMLETRGLIQESVSKGTESNGFRLFRRVCEEVCRAQVDGGYRRYLELLFDEIAGELRVLFDRSLPSSTVFPRPSSLNGVIGLLNESLPSEVWKSDETIGWIYQYYTPKEYREALRDSRRGGSQAPRNSYELAVRNQFYTPRYVVEFLTDNTLARTWYEMYSGQTRLSERCSYLVRQPNDVFLAKGQSQPAEASSDNQPEADLSRKLTYIKHRTRKDPRDIRVLDPACGSGHFLLYAFDLFLTIYEEAWSDPDSPAFSETGRSLRDDYPELTKLRRELAGLVLRYNLYGIDIDLRATQIAALALWLRAQRAYQDLGLKAADRPQIRRSNIVCAEPMPGDHALLDEFLSDLKPAVLRQLVRVIFQKMQLAGEAGSLLKIEDEIRDAVAEAKRQWTRGPVQEQLLLIPEARRPIVQQQVLFDTSGITEEGFWHDAEERILDELGKYAGHATRQNAAARQLFAEDAAQGFAFVDLCRKRFDVVLMNPPFGEFSKNYKAEARNDYPNSYNDIFAAFTECFLDRLEPRGFLGAITSRTGFFLTTFVRWRQEVLMKKSALECLVDLGLEVMDDAMVEAAAYCLERSLPRSSTPFFRVLGRPDRTEALLKAIRSLREGTNDPVTLQAGQRQFSLLPDVPFVYWVKERILEKFAVLSPLSPDAAEVRQGLATADDPRFARAIWEVPNDTLSTDGSGKGRWVPYVKAGTSQPWYSPITLVVNWADEGAEIRNNVNARGDVRSNIWMLRDTAARYFFKPGFSWTRRAVRFIPYIVPAGCIPSASRYMAYPSKGLEFATVGVSASNVATSFLRFYGEWFARPNYMVETVKALPWPGLSQDLSSRLEKLARLQVDRRRRAYQSYEPFHEFTAPAALLSIEKEEALSFDVRSLLGLELDTEVAQAYGFDSDERGDLERDLREAIQSRRVEGRSEDSAEEDEEDASDSVIPMDQRSDKLGVLSYAVGCAFGRWDVRFALDQTLIPRSTGPFDPLPACPPGALIGVDGLPARSGGIVSEAWIRARRDWNTLPDAQSVSSPIISNQEYPLPNLPWDGILVDDEGHPVDISLRVRDVLRLLFGDAADKVEAEACALIGVKDLRSYFRNARNFFSEHIRQYSKSRRKAPIYWLLQSARKTYGVWLYYHRLTRDTLFHLLQAYVEPKIRLEDARRHELRRMYELAKASNNIKNERELAKKMDDQEAIASELADFKSKIQAVAYGKLAGAEPECRGWDPNLSDGVILNIAPLHSVVPWKEPTKTWHELAGAEYDWSHVAMCFWPKRVEDKCRQDRSIALAHGMGVE
jgi:hypothetical protein